MADQETKADEKEDQDDTSGHSHTAATPDEDRDLKSHTAVSGDDDDDTEGHKLTS
jgi:hypothetical protein